MEWMNKTAIELVLEQENRRLRAENEWLKNLTDVDRFSINYNAEIICGGSPFHEFRAVADVEFKGSPFLFHVLIKEKFNDGFAFSYQVTDPDFYRATVDYRINALGRMHEKFIISLAEEFNEITKS